MYHLKATNGSFGPNKAPSALQMAPLGPDKTLYGHQWTLKLNNGPIMVAYWTIWPFIVKKLDKCNVDCPFGHRNPLCQHKMLIYGPELYMRGQKGPIMVNWGPYLTHKEPNAPPKRGISACMGPNGTFEACKWSIQDQMGLQRPQKEPKGLHRAPRLGPTKSYGDEQQSLFSMFCWILFCFILIFSFITF